MFTEIDDITLLKVNGGSKDDYDFGYFVGQVARYCCPPVFVANIIVEHIQNK
jgi:hypothetical protein